MVLRSFMRTIPKETTTTRLIQMVTYLPNAYTRAELARMLGVSRERTRQIVKKHHLESLVIKYRHSPPILCLNCGKEIDSQNRTRLCITCIIAQRFDQVWGRYICPTCDKENLVLKSKLKANKNHYCNRHCLFVMLGKTYGKQALKKYWADRKN